MTSILCVGDIHARDKAPSGAHEPYLDDLLDLLRQTATLAAERAVDAVVWAGDVFHEKEPRKTSHATVQRMIEIVQSYPCPLYIVPGNHDISNDRLESIDDKQPLGILYRAGAIKLDGWVEDLSLYGIPWQSNWHEEGAIAWAFDAWREWGPIDTSKCLAVTHASLYPPGLEPPFDVLDIGEVAGALGKSGGSVYYGHIHEYHGVFEVEGVTFANMGALSRGSLHEYNVSRPIKVALWKDGVFEEIELEYKPGEEVLRVEEHREEKRSQLSVKNFLDSIGNQAIEISSTGSILNYIDTRVDVHKPVRDLAKDLIEHVSE